MGHCTWHANSDLVNSKRVVELQTVEKVDSWRNIASDRQQKSDLDIFAGQLDAAALVHRFRVAGDVHGHRET
jgi:hypothetical protein